MYGVLRIEQSCTICFVVGLFQVTARRRLYEKSRNMLLLWIFNYLLIIFHIIKIVLDCKTKYVLLIIENTSVMPHLKNSHTH
jgi:hypothetical protein